MILSPFKMYNVEEFESRYLCEIKSIYHFISHTCMLVCNKYSELNPDCRDLTAFFLLGIKNNLSSCFKLVFVNIIKYQKHTFNVRIGIQDQVLEVLVRSCHISESVSSNPTLLPIHLPGFTLKVAGDGSRRGIPSVTHAGDAECVSGCWVWLARAQCLSTWSRTVSLVLSLSLIISLPLLL